MYIVLLRKSSSVYIAYYDSLTWITGFFLPAAGTRYHIWQHIRQWQEYIHQLFAILGIVTVTWCMENYAQGTRLGVFGIDRLSPYHSETLTDTP